jgi:hypothetical protein
MGSSKCVLGQGFTSALCTGLPKIKKSSRDLERHKGKVNTNPKNKFKSCDDKNAASRGLGSRIYRVEVPFGR